MERTKKEYLTYSKESGFNIVEAENEQEAEDFNCICLDEISEVDSQIINRIRELIKDE